MERLVFGPIHTYSRNYWLLHIGNRIIEFFLENNNYVCRDGKRVAVAETLEAALDKLNVPWYLVDKGENNDKPNE
jgi:hypothetical protein